MPFQRSHQASSVDVPESYLVVWTFLVVWTICCQQHAVGKKRQRPTLAANWNLSDRDDRLVAALVLELFEARRDQRYVLTNLAAPFVYGAGQRVLIVDDLANGKYPMPIDGDGKDPVYIGRIREDLSSENGLAFWCVSGVLIRANRAYRFRQR